MSVPARSRSRGQPARPTAPRPILTAELLSIGTELTVGDTRDTNAGELARTLAARGVYVSRLSALPDELDAVRGAFEDALRRSDLVVSTGGLGPTPDDLTRESIAEVCGESPRVDDALERWLRNLWSRRNLPFVDANLKQAWLIPSARAITNENGTAPGWWVDRPDGRVIVALPGPPREMRPMWHDSVLPRLIDRGLGRAVEVRTLRTTGIGESQLVDRLGEPFMRRSNPVVTTYARQDAVDVRIAAVPDEPDRIDAATDGDGRTRSASEIADDAEAVIVERLGDHIWGRGEATWADAIDERLAAHDWRLATVEAGTGAAVATLLGGLARLRRMTSFADSAELPGRRDPDAIQQPTEHGRDTDGTSSVRARVQAAARWAREDAAAEVGMAVLALHRGDDTEVHVAVETPEVSHHELRVVFLGGAQGRQRAAIAALSILHATLIPEGDR